MIHNWLLTEFGAGRRVMRPALGGGVSSLVSLIPNFIELEIKGASATAGACLFVVLASSTIYLVDSGGSL